MKGVVIALFVIICWAFIFSYLWTGKPLIDHLTTGYWIFAIVFVAVAFFALNLILNGKWW